jgi:hypothetical protein
MYLADATFDYTEGFWNSGIDFETLHMPDDPAIQAEIAKLIRGALVAWDPVAQEEVWRYQHAGPWNGGTLATAGNLVFQGSLIGEFAAFNASTGERVWQFNAQTGVAAAPMGYAADGAQHIAVAAGWGTLMAMFGGEPTAAMNMQNRSRILAFKIGGTVSLPESPAIVRPPIPKAPPTGRGGQECLLRPLRRLPRHECRQRRPRARSPLRQRRDACGMGRDRSRRFAAG